MRAFSGPDGGARPASAPAAARVLAEVQAAAAGRLDDLRSTGVPDRGLDRTLVALAEMVREGTGVRTLDAGERRLAARLPGETEVKALTGDGSMEVRLSLVPDGGEIRILTEDGVLTGPEHIIEITDLSGAGT